MGNMMSNDTHQICRKCGKLDSFCLCKDTQQQKKECHTSGKWEAQRLHVVAIGEEYSHTIVEKVDGWTIAESKANAHLIAAAPELLAALKAFCMDHTLPCGCENCRIIAKAEGKGQA